MHQCKYQDNPACDCSNVTRYIVNDCPKRKFEGEMNDFFTLTSKALDCIAKNQENGSGCKEKSKLETMDNIN